MNPLQIQNGVSKIYWTDAFHRKYFISIYIISSTVALGPENWSFLSKICVIMRMCANAFTKPWHTYTHSKLLSSQNSKTYIEATVVSFLFSAEFFINNNHTQCHSKLDQILDQISNGKWDLKLALLIQFAFDISI